MLKFYKPVLEKGQQFVVKTLIGKDRHRIRVHRIHEKRKEMASLGESNL